MAIDETDAEFHARLLARSRANKASRLASRKREARARGKQPFDLDLLERYYDTSVEGWLPERAARAADYEYRYYVVFPETMRLAEYAAVQSAIDAAG